MKAICPRRVFRYWTSRLALAAMLALAVVPTAGRLYAGASGAAIAHAAHAAQAGTDAAHGHAHGMHAADADATAPQPFAPAPGGGHADHADCPYCPLLAQLAGSAPARPLMAIAPPGPAPSLAVTPGHAARRPHGLHARGPPTTA